MRLKFKYIRPVICLPDSTNEAMTRRRAELTSTAYDCNLPHREEKVAVISLVRNRSVPLVGEDRRKLLMNMRQLWKESGDQVHSLGVSKLLRTWVWSLGDEVVDSNETSLLQVRYVASWACNDVRCVALLLQQVIVDVEFDHLLEFASTSDFGAMGC